MSESIQYYAGAQTAALWLRRARRQPGDRLPQGCRPQTQGQALAVQQAQAALSLVAGDPIAGWKCGLPLEGALRLAPIYVSGLHQGGALGGPEDILRLEPEIAFELTQDLPPRDLPYSRDEIDMAIGSARLALEILGSRYLDPHALPHCELLADHLFNAGLVLGPTVAQPEPAAITLELEHAGRVQTLAGHHPDGEPRAPLYWLVNFLRENGLGLVAGQHIITGSYAGCLEVPAQGQLALRFGDLGAMTLELGLRR